MKSIGFGTKRPLLVALFVFASTLAVGVSPCDAQWGYFGRGSTAARGAFKYRGPVLSIQFANPYPASPWAGADDPVLAPSLYGSAFGASPYDRYRLDDVGISTSSVYDRYRGVQPTQAELDRERFYQNLDRTHRYTTREERYGNDFFNAYASPSAMVNRYRDPYVAGTPAVPWTPLPIPGLYQNRYDSNYQGYVPDDDVAVALRAAAIRLINCLTRKADGHIWIRHLQPQRIVDAIDRGEDPAVLSDLLVNYQGVADTPRLVLIAEAEGFKDVRRLLSQYVTLPSPYPSIQGSDAWQSSSPIGQETIIDERVIGEKVIGDNVIDDRAINKTSPNDTSLNDTSIDDKAKGDNDPLLDPPSLPIPPKPKFQAKPPIDPPKQEIQMNDPRLDSLPDDADVELLPAPVPTPVES